MSDRPMPSSFDGNEDFYNEKSLSKILRKLKEEPLIPIGCVLTVMAFTNAWRASRRGDHKQVQRMFRARVAAQGFTVLAMVAGGMYYAEDRRKNMELWKLKKAQEAEEKRLKWIKELEARDDEDKAVRARLDKMRRRAEGRKDAAADLESKEKLHGEDKGVVVDGANGAVGGEETKADSSILGSLGGLFGGPSKAPTTATAGTPPETKADPKPRPDGQARESKEPAKK